MTEENQKLQKSPGERLAFLLERMQTLSEGNFTDEDIRRLLKLKRSALRNLAACRTLGPIGLDLMRKNLLSLRAAAQFLTLSESEQGELVRLHGTGRITEGIIRRFSARKDLWKKAVSKHLAKALSVDGMDGQLRTLLNTVLESLNC